MIRAFLSVLLLAPCVHAARQAPGKPALTRTERAAAFVRLGRRMAEERRYPEAVAQFEHAMHLDPDSAEAAFRLGDAHYRRAYDNGAAEPDREAAESALNAYQTALSLDGALGSVSDPYQLHLGMSLCLDALGRSEEAIERLKAAARLAPRNPMPQLYAARLRWRMGIFDLSAANLRAGVQRARRRNQYPALAKLVRTHPMFSAMLGAPENRAVLEAYDSVDRGLLSEAEAKERLDDGRALRDALSAAAPRRTRPAAFDEEEAAGLEALKILEKANSEFLKGIHAAAIESYARALQADKSSGRLDAGLRSLAHERIGISARHLGDDEKALAHLREAVEESPGNASARFQLALLHSAVGERAEALVELEKALSGARSDSEKRRLALAARAEPDLEPLHQTERYRQILRAHH